MILNSWEFWGEDKIGILYENVRYSFILKSFLVAFFAGALNLWELRPQSIN